MQESLSKCVIKTTTTCQCVRIILALCASVSTNFYARVSLICTFMLRNSPILEQLRDIRVMYNLSHVLHGHYNVPPFWTLSLLATDRPLMGNEGWLETYTFPAEQSLHTDLDRAQKVYDAVVNTTLQAGTTTAVYFATLHLEPCKVLVDVALARGQRAFVGKVCMDRNSPPSYIQSTQENMDETRALIEYIHNVAGREDATSSFLLPLVMPIVTPRFIPTCTPELMKELGQVAAKYNCHVQSHISESIDEVDFSRHLDATCDVRDGVGRTDAKIFHSHGLLNTNRCIMAHGVHLSDDDLDLLQTCGAAVAHCPLSNFYFAGGTLLCRKLMERGNRVGLGTDVAGGYSPSMAHAARMAVIASLLVEDSNTTLDYRHAFYLATLGGAEALGLETKIGTLGVAMEFDAVVLSPEPPIHIFDTDTMDDVFQKLCTLGDDRHVKQVYVQGKLVVNRAQR